MVSLGLILEYKVIFPDEEPKPLKDYFIGAGRERVLKLGAFLLGFKNQGSKYSNNVTTLSTVFGRENNEFANDVYRKIVRQESELGEKIQIFQPFVSLKLYDFFFKHCFDDEQPQQSAAELEVNFFKAYLLVGSEF